MIAASGAGFRFQRFAVPFGIVEKFIGFDEIVDGKIVLAVKKPGTAADNLFELNHLLDRAHQHDIADIAGIDTGRELL